MERLDTKTGLERHRQSRVDMTTQLHKACGHRTLNIVHRNSPDQWPACPQPIDTCMSPTLLAPDAMIQTCLIQHIPRTSFAFAQTSRDTKIPRSQPVGRLRNGVVDGPFLALFLADTLPRTCSHLCFSIQLSYPARVFLIPMCPWRAHLHRRATL